MKSNLTYGVSKQSWGAIEEHLENGMIDILFCFVF